MEWVINQLTTNPVYMGIAVILAIIILLGVIKKMFKIVLVVAAALVIYIAYMTWQGQEVSVDSLKEDLKSATEKVTEKVEDIKKETVDKAVENIIK